MFENQSTSSTQFTKLKFIIPSLVILTGVLTLSSCSQKDSMQAAEDHGLTFVAGSELRVIEPILKDAQNKLGFPINLKYSGTIEGVESVKNGEAYDVAWFGNSKYFYDSPESSKRIKLSEKIMYSPVIVGVKQTSFDKYQLKKDAAYNWKDISSWIKDKHMSYAMTDPSTSNTGYVALMGVVYATTNKGENLTIKDVKKDVVQDFFKGQTVTAKSSDWLVSKFNESNVDFIVNYESSILNNPEPLVPVYPNEGIVTADYPMLLLNDKKTEQYKKLVAYLKENAVQQELVNTYKYRSFNADVMAKQAIFKQDQLLVEMPFNPEQQLSDAILDAYFNELKKPAKFAFVIDTSGSMGGSRENELKTSLDKLLTNRLSRYTNLRDRETVLVVPFQSDVYDEAVFDNKHTTEMNNYIQHLKMDGGTAMYSAVLYAINKLQEERKKYGDQYRYSVVVLTDGITNEGFNFNNFEQWYNDKKFTKGDMRVFAISFGDADLQQLNNLSNLTGGKVFDGKTSLSSAFKEIRSYQ